MATILVIDDDNFMRKAMRLMIEEHGHSVIEADTGIKGEHALEFSKVDIIFTDIFMPEQDGIQTIINIKKIMPDIPIVAITSAHSESMTCHLKQAKLLGASIAYCKPITAENIHHALFTLLS